MPARPYPVRGTNLLFALLCALLVALWVAGGASRGDVLAQVAVRSVAWAALLALVLFGAMPSLREVRAVLLLLLAAAALILVQLLPLPPGLWEALPGRAPLTSAAVGQAQPWRPMAIVPGAAVNALSSLIVPFTILLLTAGAGARGRAWLPGILLGLVTASMLVGLLQVSGARFDYPLVNDTPGEIGGNFANRNHLALFVATGCLLAPAWAFLGGRRPGWRAPAALGLVLLFALTILASGSRAGILTGALALVLGLIIARGGIRRALDRAPRWAFPALLAAIVGLIGGMVLLSVMADRAVSIERAISADASQDMRARALPTVLAMIRTYFPAGSGFGGFDPIFRMHEPFALLKPTFLNHAHNDFLEIVLDGGLPGALLLVVALGWWAIASVRAWRTKSGGSLARLGSALLLLVIVASLFDYPARTPMIMALVTIAATWLAHRPEDRGTAALPGQDQHL